MEEMQKADIEVWDCNYLYNEFKKQINELKESRYSHLIKKIVDKYEDEDVYGNLIKSLTIAKPDLTIGESISNWSEKF